MGDSQTKVCSETKCGDSMTSTIAKADWNNDGDGDNDDHYHFLRLSRIINIIIFTIIYYYYYHHYYYCYYYVSLLILTHFY